MRLRELVEDGIEIFALQGEIDLHYAPVLRSLLQNKIKARCPSLILDLSAVDYIDSTGLATIIEYFRDAAEYGGVLCLARRLVWWEKHQSQCKCLSAPAFAAKTARSTAEFPLTPEETAVFSCSAFLRLPLK